MTYLVPFDNKNQFDALVNHLLRNNFKIVAGFSSGQSLFSAGAPNRKPFGLLCFDTTIMEIDTYTFSSEKERENSRAPGKRMDFNQFFSMNFNPPKILKLSAIEVVVSPNKVRISTNSPVEFTYDDIIAISAALKEMDEKQ